MKPQLRKFVVADMETRVPVRDAVVSTKSGYRDTTNYRGICYIPVLFDTLSVTHGKYLTERLTAKEIKDTTYLIPTSHQISEVTVWGDSTPSVSKGLTEQVHQIFRDNTRGGLSFDFAKMLDKRYRRDMKHLRKTREIFKEMDKDDEDPIVRAYKEAMEEKKRVAEKEKGGK
uniref:hypothetical protein n=1 Tax=Prevotella sp. TaxID=59823 RepID=UPI0040296F1C